MVTEDDFVPGDPARIVLGKDEEKSARVHGPRPERKPTLKTIHADVKVRMQELDGVVEEHDQLEAALKALEGI
jgi:hypothetical protein